ncbi:MAG: outer membrane beta-barrel protein [Bacteroidales bacterium]|nr:outer membrane beta-barrel protein [Bacteroidales bacterium]
MIIKKQHIRNLLLSSVLLSVAVLQGFSQGTDISGRKFPMFYVGFNLIPVQTQLINEGDFSSTGFTTEKTISFSGGIETGCLFSNFFGISLGAGYGSYSSNHLLESYEFNYTTTDSENDSYERRITGTDISENQNVSFLNIPVTLNFSIPFNRNKMGFFVHTGVNFMLPMTNTFASSGTFTYKGYYPAYNVLLEDLPAYGFGTNIKNETAGDLVMKSINLNFLVSGGFEMFVSKKIQLAAGILYTASLSDISDYEKNDTFILSEDANRMASFMEGSTRVSSRGLGAILSLNIFLK